ncbi:hypothetical protein tb265_48330 [Gemmatimonadetes bacterium T265]|nr:hypothetical protein tb265_48330 [Gemmatimonadetes bacterium T265]
MKARSASLRFPAALFAGAAALILALPTLRAETAVPDALLGAALAVLLLVGGAELALRVPWSSSPAWRLRAGIGAAVGGAAGVLCCAVAASDVADGWPAGARTAAVLAAVVGLPMLAGGSAMVRQAEHARDYGVVTYSHRRSERV